MTKDIDQTTITDLLTYASHAPSVHNAQPWNFEVKDSAITLRVAPERALKAGDPTSRELWISLGACFETLLQSAKGLGLTAVHEFVQTDSITGPIATIRIQWAPEACPETLPLIMKRYSYRGRMDRVPLPRGLLTRCQEACKDLPGISVGLLQERSAITKVAHFTFRAMRLALGSPDFRKELITLINYNWSSKRRGMHGYVLNHGLIGSVWEKWSLRLGLGLKQKARADEQKVLEASGLIFIMSKGDVPSFWFDGGRAYMRVALEITRAGLDQSTIAAPVEASSFHEDIEALLQTPYRIQAMIRIGKAARPLKRTSPRLRVDELLQRV